ncbi:MAG: hypothetical protein PVH41_09135, partial [Anaerolineae bacterium]
MSKSPPARIGVRFGLAGLGTQRVGVQEGVDAVYEIFDTGVAASGGAGDPDRDGTAVLGYAESATDGRLLALDNGRSTTWDRRCTTDDRRPRRLVGCGGSGSAIGTEHVGATESPDQVGAVWSTLVAAVAPGGEEDEED